MRMKGYMIHANFNDMAWHILFTGFLLGAILLAVASGSLSELRAAIYSKLI